MSRNKGTKLVSYLLAWSYVTQNICIIKFRTFEVCMLSLYTYVRLQFVYTFFIQLLTIKQYTCLCHMHMFFNLYARIFSLKESTHSQGGFQLACVVLPKSVFLCDTQLFWPLSAIQYFHCSHVLLLFIGLYVYYALLVIYQQCLVAKAHDDIIFLLRRRKSL